MLKEKEVFSNPDSFATSLLMMSIDRWGFEFLDWDPTTIISEVGEAFGEDWPQINQDKLLAICTTLTSDSFYTDPLAFYHICCALNNIPVNWNSIADELAPDQMAWAVLETGMLDVDEENKTPPFSDTVAAFVGLALHERGFYDPPKILNFAAMPRSGGSAGNDILRARLERDRVAQEELAVELSDRIKAMREELSQLPLSTRSNDEDRDYISELFKLRGR